MHRVASTDRVRSWRRFLVENLKQVSIFLISLGLGAAAGSAVLSADFAAQAQETPQRRSSQPPEPSAASIAGHCWCEVSCQPANGQPFERNAGFPGYTQGLDSDECESACNQYVGSSIQGWAAEQNICGAVSCSGTSHVGDEPRRRYRDLAGASHNRTCCPAAASSGLGCHPGSSQDLISVFQIVETGDINDPYRLIYSPSQAVNYDAILQAYTDYVRFRPNLHHIWAGHSLEELMPDGSWSQLAWGAVRYVPLDPGGHAGNGFFDQPISEGKTYRVWRWLFPKDLNDQDIAPLSDPSCTHIGFRITIAVTPLQGLSGVTNRGPALATISVDGQPDRMVRVEMESPLERSRRQQLAQAPIMFERPRDFRPDSSPETAQGGAARR